VEESITLHVGILGLWCYRSLLFPTTAFHVNNTAEAIELT